MSAQGSESGAPTDLVRFFEVLRELGPLRVISQCGPSTFEALCEVSSFSLGQGFLNAITPAYHWHIRADRVRHLTSRDEVHGRSGRRVLFFELREGADQEPFLRIYLHREKGEEFAAEREKRFLDAHAALSAGHDLAPPS